jgi:hypothetical protein
MGGVNPAFFLLPGNGFFDNCPDKGVPDSVMGNYCKFVKVLGDNDG